MEDKKDGMDTDEGDFIAGLIRNDEDLGQRYNEMIDSKVIDINCMVNDIEKRFQNESVLDNGSEFQNDGIDIQKKTSKGVEFFIDPKLGKVPKHKRDFAVRMNPEFDIRAKTKGLTLVKDMLKNTDHYSEYNKDNIQYTDDYFYKVKEKKQENEEK